LFISISYKGLERFFDADFRESWIDIQEAVALALDNVPSSRPADEDFARVFSAEGTRDPFDILGSK